MGRRTSSMCLFTLNCDSPTKHLAYVPLRMVRREGQRVDISTLVSELESSTVVLVALSFWISCSLRFIKSYVPNGYTPLYFKNGLRSPSQIEGDEWSRTFWLGTLLITVPPSKVNLLRSVSLTSFWSLDKEEGRRLI